MRLMPLMLPFAVLALVLAVALTGVSGSMAAWAAEQQRAFQNGMAEAVRGLRSGAPGAWTALLGAALAYGFVHAVGPGHGKYLIGGMGLGSAVSLPRLLTISVVSSLLQALWAILLVYGGFLLFETSAQRLAGLAEDQLAVVSHAAIALIGAVLVWRGLSRLRERAGAETVHGADTACCHSHGPSASAVAQATSLRATMALILSVAIRPCTGAVFLLVIAWQMRIETAGAVAVMAMGAGTAALTSLVAVSSVAARGLSLVSAERMGVLSRAGPALQIAAGLVILWISLLLLGGTL